MKSKKLRRSLLGAAVLVSTIGIASQMCNREFSRYDPQPSSNPASSKNYNDRYDVVLVTMTTLKKEGKFHQKIREYIDTVRGTERLKATYFELDSDQVKKTFGVKVENNNDPRDTKNLLRKITEKTGASYIVILGGTKVIPRPFVSIGCPSTMVHGDNHYIDFDADQILDEGLSISRLPDVDYDSDAIIKALNTSIFLHKRGGFTISKPAKFSIWCEGEKHCYDYCADDSRGQNQATEILDIISSSDYVHFTGHATPFAFFSGDSTSFSIESCPLFDIDHTGHVDLTTHHPIIAAYTGCNAGRLPEGRNGRSDRCPY